MPRNCDSYHLSDLDDYADFGNIDLINFSPAGLYLIDEGLIRPWRYCKKHGIPFLNQLCTRRRLELVENRVRRSVAE